jgi:hypothetical protein
MGESANKFDFKKIYNSGGRNRQQGFGPPLFFHMKKHDG